jgi:hypothetical protein
MNIKDAKVHILCYDDDVYTVAVNKDLNAMVAKRIIKQYHLQVAGV